MKKLFILFISFLLCSYGWCGVDLDGTDGRLAQPNSATLSPGTGTFSVFCWFKTSKDYTGVEGWIWSVYGMDTNNLIVVNIGGDNKLRGVYRDINGNNVTVSASGSVVNDGVWHHVAWVRTSQTAANLYLDGTSIGTDTDVALGTITTSNGSTPFIGIHKDIGDKTAFDGEITEIAVWKGIATVQSEIDLLVDAHIKGMPSQIQSANLSAYLSLDDHPAGTSINGLTFKDRSGNGNDGTGSDAGGQSVTVSESVLSYAPGVIGN